MSRFAYLCVTLIALMIVSALGGTLRELSTWFSLIESASYIAVLIATLFAVSNSRRTQVAGLVLATPAITSSVCVAVSPTHGIHVLHGVLSAAFLCFVAVRVMIHLFRCSTVDTNTLCAAVSGYLLIGLAWAAMYSVIYDMDASSFHANDQTVADELGVAADSTVSLFYFSFVTLSTLGYGDIVPVSPAAKLLAIVEVVLGQVYLTILVARLVGLHLVRNSSPSSGE